MTNAFNQLGIFAAELFLVFIFIVAILITFMVIAAKNKGASKGQLKIKNLNKKLDEQSEALLSETLSKKEFKKYIKDKKVADKQREAEGQRNIYVIDFQGDIKASNVDALSETVTAVLNIATLKDEIVVRLENAGGYVHTHGLASAQLMRIRAKKIPLTITIDKIAASGGYLMACVGDKILSAPFAIIGSIGVLIQLPNFHRALKDKHIDFVQLTAGEYKRTVTMFGENTEAGREKLRQEINEVHELFKQTIKQNRPQIDIDRVATGEHWLGQQALKLQLVDAIKTSDDYLSELKNHANIYEICFETKRSLINKIFASGANLREKIFGSVYFQ